MRSLAAAVAAAVIALTFVGASDANRPLMPGHWYRLAVCESGHNPPNWHHDSGTYQGAFGFYYGTWDQYRYPGYPREAYNATPTQQYRVALRVSRAIGGIRFGWGCWRGADHAWVRGGVSYYTIE